MGLPASLPPVEGGGEPSQSRLCTWVDVEPRTGMTVALSRRSQLSAAVPLPMPLSPRLGSGSSSSSSSSSGDPAPPLLPGGATLLPLLWHDRRGEVTPAAADAFARRVTRLEDAASHVATIGLSLCGAAVTLAAWCWLWGCRLRKHARLERLEEGAGRRMAGALAAAALRSVSGLRLDDDSREGGGEGAAAAVAEDGRGVAQDDADSPQPQAEEEWMLRPLLVGDGQWRTGGEGRPASETGPPTSTPPSAPVPTPQAVPAHAWGGTGGGGWAALATSADDGEGGGWPGPSLAELEGGGWNDEWGPEQAAAAAAPLYWSPRTAPGGAPAEKGDAAMAATWLLDSGPPSPRDTDRDRQPLLQLQSLRRGGVGIQ